MNPLILAGKVVTGAAVFVASTVGMFVVCMGAESRRQRRNRELVRDVTA